MNIWRLPGGKQQFIYCFIGFQFLAVLFYGLPGHVSTDSIVQLYEGMFGKSISFNPPFMSVLLGLLSFSGKPTVLFVYLVSGLLAWTSWSALATRSNFSIFRLLLAAVFLLNPVVILYSGVVWKDVLFAQSVVTLYFLVARLHQSSASHTWLKHLAVFGLMCSTIGTRQQGMLFALPAAVLWAVSFKLRPMLTAALSLAMVCVPPIFNKYVVNSLIAPSAFDDVDTGLRILARFDMVGVLANGGEIDSRAPDVVRSELKRDVQVYTPYRVDTLIYPAPKFIAFPSNELAKTYFSTLLANPVAYGRHRADVFKAFIGLSDVRKCAPVHAGVGGPIIHPLVGKDLVPLIGLTTNISADEMKIYQFGWEGANTPLFMHASYLVVLVFCIALLFLLKEYVLCSLSFLVLFYVLSYLFLGIACDFRYGYLLTLSTSLLTAVICCRFEFKQSFVRELPAPLRWLAFSVALFLFAFSGILIYSIGLKFDAPEFLGLAIAMVFALAIYPVFLATCSPTAKGKE